jgi:hypothetical protein
MRTVIVGNRKLARHLLRQTLAEGWNVVGALVPAGELAATQANFVPVSELVADTACQLHATQDINSTETFEWLEAVDPDLCLCGGWSQIIETRIRGPSPTAASSAFIRVASPMVVGVHQ